MMAVEREKLAAVVSAALGAYSKAITPAEMEGWWGRCRDFSLADIERALKDHEDDPDDGKRAPRPVDVTRRLRAGTRTGSGCAARGVAGACQYPGIFSDDTHGSSTWWCPWHVRERSGPEAERWLQVSHDVPYETAAAKRAERMRGEATRTPGVVETAHAIALRHGNKPWQGTRFAAPINPDAEEAA